MAKCVICNRKLVKTDNKVCPDCGEIFHKVGDARIVAPNFKKKMRVTMLFAKNKIFFRTYNPTANMFGLLGALLSSNQTASYNTADVAKVEYPVEVPKLSKKAIVIHFNDGSKIELGAMGSNKKTVATYEALSAQFNK